MPVEPAARVSVPDPLADIVRASLAWPDVVETASPPPFAADFIFIPVVEDGVEVSILKAGLVIPLAPTANAFVEVLRLPLFTKVPFAVTRKMSAPLFCIANLEVELVAMLTKKFESVAV